MAGWMKWTLLGLTLSLAACGTDADGDSANSSSAECNGGKCDVIGEDDRRDEFQGEVTEKLKEIARSTAMIISNESLVADGDQYSVIGQTLGETYSMCPDETFADQPSTGFCSAWLVAPDVMITNGHCLTSQQACEDSSFVFDYTIAEEGQDLSFVPTRNVVACERVLAWDYTSNCDVDYAVVKLEREVEGREPLTVRPSGDELDEDNLVIIGHPFGLPRKYALLGGVLQNGSNTFSTTHDIFGGNSGSGIFDANTGEVQGLVTCGGSNLTWEYYDEGWTLDRKTGMACDTSCDAEGAFPDGSWDVCDENNMRRRCVCDAEGTQLVWEKRECLAFENDTDGQCSREQRTDQFSCETAQWLCAAPVMQHTRHFSHFADSWTVWTHDEAQVVEPGAEVESSVEVDAEGAAQAVSVYINILGDEDPDTFDWASALSDLTISLEHGGEVYDLLSGGYAELGTAFPISDSPSGSSAFQVPFVIHNAQQTEMGGTWTLRVKNAEFGEYTLYDWSLQAIVKPVDDITDLGQFPCLEDCVSGWSEAPDPIVDAFSGQASDLEHDLVTGTIDPDWTVEVLDENGVDYEVNKTRRSQTMSLLTGEFALVRDFGEDIGGRVLTLDYRYDGDGWFQVWADDQMLITHQGFARSTDAIQIPFSARSIRVVMGATSDAQYHEATLYRLELSVPMVEPATCEGVLTCVQGCGEDATCQQSCIDVGTTDAQANFWAFSDCATSFCGDASLSDEDYNDCLQTQCAESLNACFGG